MEQQLNNLLYDLCVDLGFCIPPEDSTRISQTKSYMAKEFAKDVVSAEGMNPDYEIAWIQKISNKFIDRFGQNEIFEEDFI